MNRRLLPRLLLTPAMATLVLWMIVPLVMTIYFALIRYNLMQPDQTGFAGLENFEYFVTDPSFGTAVVNTILLLGSVILITVVFGIAIALLINEPFAGRGIVRVLLISPFFVMPTVNALMWKNMMMNPIYGVLAQVWMFFGAQPVDWLTDHPLFSVIVMVSWQWLPFATLIILTALQSFDEEQKEAAQMDGTPPLSFFWYMILPHLSRPITVVVLIETIFLLNVFAEIYVSGSGGRAGNLPFLVYQYGLLSNDIGGASAGGIIAVVLANIVAFFLMRMIGKNLEG